MLFVGLASAFLTVPKGLQLSFARRGIENAFTSPKAMDFVEVDEVETKMMECMVQMKERNVIGEGISVLTLSKELKSPALTWVGLPNSLGSFYYIRNCYPKLLSSLTKTDQPGSRNRMLRGTAGTAKSSLQFFIMLNILNNCHGFLPELNPQAGEGEFYKRKFVMRQYGNDFHLYVSKNWRHFV